MSIFTDTIDAHLAELDRRQSIEFQRELAKDGKKVLGAFSEDLRNRTEDIVGGKMSDFVVKDSGKREEFSGGMVRDVEDSKTDYTLVLDGPMFERWAIHLTKGAKKYAARNWMKAEGEVELERFKRSALRHFLQWFRGEVDEDHGAAVLFNINGAEYVKSKKQRENKFMADVHAAMHP